MDEQLHENCQQQISVLKTCMALLWLRAVWLITSSLHRSCQLVCKHLQTTFRAVVRLWDVWRKPETKLHFFQICWLQLQGSSKRQELLLWGEHSLFPVCSALHCKLHYSSESKWWVLTEKLLSSIQTVGGRDSLWRPNQSQASFWFGILRFHLTTASNLLQTLALGEYTLVTGGFEGLAFKHI